MGKVKGGKAGAVKRHQAYQGKKPKASKPISELSVDELMNGSSGVDSADVSDESSDAELPLENKPKAKTKQQPKKKKQELTASDDSEVENEEELAHDMEQLKHTDPEFYAFLKQDEPALLDFKPSMKDDDEEETGDEEEDVEDEDEEDSEGSGEEEQDGVQFDASDSEEDDDDEDSSERVVITRQMVQEWEKRVFEDWSLTALKQLLDAFRCAVHMNDAEPDDDETESGKQKSTKGKRKYRYKLDNSAIFNALVVLCLNRMHEALDHHIQMPKEQHGGSVVASRCPNWRKYKNICKGYIANLLHFTRQIVDPSMLAFVLKAVDRAASYFAAFPKIGRALLKTCVDLWGQAEEHVRVVSFLVVRRFTIIAPKTFLDSAIRALYMTYAKSAKFTTAQNQPTLTFMENCVVEICSINPFVTYTHAFVYIRQLAIHLRAATTSRKKDAFASVYNWQYLHCVQAWCRVVSEHYCATFAPLTYPLTQILFGTIRMIPTARYFPLRFHCVRSLNMLGKSTRTYIPVASVLLEVVDSQYVKANPKKAVTKPPLFPYIYKVSKSMLGTKTFQEGCIDQVVGLMIEHVAIYSTHIAFPEMAVPIIVQLRTFLSTCKNSKAKGQLKQILDKTKENIAYIATLREQVPFAPRDAKDVSQWNHSLATKAASPLMKFSESWAKIEKAREKSFEMSRATQDDMDTDEDESEEDFEEEDDEREKPASSSKRDTAEDRKRKDNQRSVETNASKGNMITFDSDDDAALEDDVRDLDFEFSD